MLSNVIAFLRTHGVLSAALPNSLPPKPERMASQGKPTRATALTQSSTTRPQDGGHNRQRDMHAHTDAPATRQRSGEQAEPRKRVEPAMHSIPRDAMQMPPRAASPGLPPVDPVNRRTAHPASEAEATTPLHFRTASTDSGSPGQGICAANLCPVVAPKSDANPCGDPSMQSADVAPCEPIPRETASVGNDISKLAEREAQNSDFAIPVDTCGHSAISAAKDQGDDPSQAAPVSNCELANEDLGQAGPLSEALDTRSQNGSPCADEVPTPRRRLPPRIAERPHVEEWADDELLTLPEAAALFWPAGPITTNTLRTAGRDGTLTITKVAGKFFTTPIAIRRMGVEDPTAQTREVQRGIAEVSPETLFQTKLAEAKRLTRERARPGRVAKRSVAPAARNGRAGQ